MTNRRASRGPTQSRVRAPAYPGGCVSAAETDAASDVADAAIHKLFVVLILLVVFRIVVFTWNNICPDVVVDTAIIFFNLNRIPL